MNLLTNAIESIQVGIADYRVATRPRLLSAVRNLHAGILLLFKEALRRRSEPGSDEALLKEKIRPVQCKDGHITFKGFGKKTATVQTIKERFHSLKIVTEWDLFKKINNVRNEIEHYYPEATAESLKELVASAFWLIRGFVTRELQENPSTLLGQETWQVMLEVAEIYNAERRVCDNALEKVEWESATLVKGLSKLRCQPCGSDLLQPKTNANNLDEYVMRCTVCDSIMDADTFVPVAISEALAFEMYLVYDDGADEPYVECPECGLSTYVVEEQSCARCGATVEETHCTRCGGLIQLDELTFAPLCSYCDYKMSKDD